MALRLFDGFNTYGAVADLVANWQSAINASLVTGRRAGSKALNIASNESLLRVFDAQSTWIVGRAVLFNSLIAAETLIYLSTAAGEQLSLRVDSAGYLYVSRAGTTLWSGAGNNTYRLNAGVWAYVELKATINTTTGSFSVRVNGLSSTAVTQTNVNTAGQGGTAADRVILGPHNNARMTDIYICDGTGSTHNDMLGDVRADLHTVTANGTNDGFSKSTGTDAYALVDEFPPNGDTDYIFSDTPATKTTVQISDLTYTPSQVLGVAVVSYARKDDSGARGLKNVLRTNSTDYSGSETALATAYAAKREEWAVNPNTSALFTVAEVNALEIGVEVSS